MPEDRSSAAAGSEATPGGTRDLQTAKDLERRRQVRGLVLIAVLVILFSVWRAGVQQVFAAGWWRFW